MQNFFKTKGAFLITIFITIVILFLCYQKYTQSHQPPPENKLSNVTIFRIQSQNIPIARSYTGRVKGIKEVAITSRLDGTIVERTYQEGQFVKKGDVLFKLDAAPFQAALAKAQANVDIMQKDFDRAQKLYNDKFLSTQDYQTALAKMQEAQADLKTAQINLDYAVITAPLDGFTSQESLTVGNLAHADSTVVTRIVQVDPIYIEFDIAEDEFIKNRQNLSTGKIKILESGLTIKSIQLDNGTEIKSTGRVDFSDTAIDVKTATASSRAIVNNPQNLLMPGQFVRLSVEGYISENTIAIPDYAVLQDDQSPYVYIVDNQDHIQIKRIKLGNLENNIRIIENGLQAQDLIIIEGMLKIKENQKIKFDKNSIVSLDVNTQTITTKQQTSGK